VLSRVDSPWHWYDVIDKSYTPLRSSPNVVINAVDLISDALSFGRLWYGEPDASAMQSATQSLSAAHMML
jgi:hypothetical protein